MTETYYDVLDVDTDADEDEIREAYRNRLHEYHPDVSDHPNAREMFLKVKEANAVLSDPAEREKYDRVGHESYVGSGESQGTGGGDTRSRRSDSRDESQRSERESTSDRSGGRDQRTSSTRQRGRSAAEEYRNRRRKTRSRSRSDRSSSGQGERSERSRSRTRRRTNRRNSGETETETEAESDEDAVESEAESEEEQDESSQTRSFGQPASEGMFVSPDIELLRFPGLAVYYFLAFEFGASLILAPVLVPLYLYYRRHKFTERFITDDVLNDTNTELVERRLGAAAVSASVLGLGVAALLVTGRLQPLAPTAAEVALVVGLVASYGVSLHYYSDMLLYDWFEATGISQPIAWDVVARAPLLVVPLLVIAPPAVSGVDAIVGALLVVSGVVPLLYFVLTGKQTGVERIDNLLVDE